MINVNIKLPTTKNAKATGGKKIVKQRRNKISPQPISSDIDFSLIILTTTKALDMTIIV
jgi:hypothetical protein